LLLKFLERLDGWRQIVNTNPAPFRPALKRDGVVQLKEINMVTSETLQAAFDRIDNRTFDVFQILSYELDFCANQDSGFEFF
jgi:hypothetical protein